MGFIQANRSQIDMIGYSLEEFVEEDSLSRIVVGIVDRIDLKVLYSCYSKQGGDAFDPSIMLAVWFLAYAEGHTSTRSVEQLCRRDLHYLYASANLKPDHCSLSRFRQRHVDSLPELFSQVVALAQAEGLARFNRISVDGSKIEASASSKANRNKEALEKELAQVREDVRGYLEQCAGEDEGQRVPEDPQKKQEVLEQALTLREARSKDMTPKNHQKHAVNLTDPDARNMSEVNGKRSKNAYNAQIAVDEDSGMIGYCSTTDEPNDRRLFQSVHQGCEEQFGFNGHRQYTADSGYHSFDQLEYISDHAIEAVIAEPRRRSREASNQDNYFHRGSFRYLVDEDSYICPAGERLQVVSKEHKRQRLQFVYQSQACPRCPLRERCLKNPANASSLRKIIRDSKEYLAEAMLAKSRSDQGRSRLKRRACSVEPVFGNLKHNLGFRRFSLRGLRNVQGEFAMMCIGHNLRKWKLKTPITEIGEAFAALSKTLTSVTLTLIRTTSPRSATFQNLLDPPRVS